MSLQLINKLLSELAADDWTSPQPFDFLVDGESFLRGSLSKWATTAYLPGRTFVLSGCEICDGSCLLCV